VLLMILAACTPPNSGAEAEVAAELRALRQVLLTRSAPDARSTTSSITDVAAARAPLRQALEGLSTNQHELQQRQLALTQELQRWSALLVQNTTGTRRDETAALSARLLELETSLQAQDVRHREMETLLQGALDRTADRLGEFLHAVGAPTEPDPVTPDAIEPPKSSEVREAPPAAGEGAPPVPPNDDSAAHAGGERWQRSSTLPWWWGGVGLLGILVGALCLRRWQRTAAGDPTRHAMWREGTAAPAAAPAADPDVQEIWAAAALLGEAVGRLRDSSTAAATEGPDATTPVLDDELIVLDDELLSPVQDATTAALPAEEPSSTRTTPVAATCRLRTSDPAGSLASVLQILQEDPRVLRRPEPAVRCSRDCLEASFRLVPDLAPGERSHLEQRLRDACGSSA
jgi:hypothetical protein